MLGNQRSTFTPDTFDILRVNILVNKDPPLPGYSENKPMRSMMCREISGVNQYTHSHTLTITDPGTATHLKRLISRYLKVQALSGTSLSASVQLKIKNSSPCSTKLI